MALFEIIIMTDDCGMSRSHTDDLALWIEDMGFTITGRASGDGLTPDLGDLPLIEGFVGPVGAGLSETGEAIIRYADEASAALIR